MQRFRAGRMLLTAILAVQTVMGFLLDWRENHLLNPVWHGHARFHGGLLLFLLAGVSLTGIWMLWRESKEPEVAVGAAALICLSFWTPFLYVAAIVPGATPWAGTSAVPRIAGINFYPNIAVAVVFQVLTAVAWRMGVGTARGAR